ncbi:MAG: DNA polymerase III subunit delta [Prevotellaceae bacterium]|jgi:DNA polymerase-3 subunit delta|nr:DNA polymerase III subunit delta [Prevotellaceae bacterium]
MAKVENKYTFEQIIKDLKAKQYAPIYFLMGKEPYYIDKIADYIEKKALSDDEKDMNQTVFYGKETKIENVIMAARQLPMMADYQIVIAKEAQNLEKTIDKLEHYVKNPTPTTILVICYKGKTLDKRKKYVKELDNKGVLFESPEVYDNQIPKFIKDYCAEKSIRIDEKAVFALTEFIGVDLARIVGEIDKLLIIKPKDAPTINEDLVLKNIGISKEYNPFELAKALGERNILLSNRIVDYFGKNPNEFKMSTTLTTIYNYFEAILQYQYSENKSEHYLQTTIGIHPFHFKNNYLPAVRNFTPNKICGIIGYIRSADTKSKGFGNVSTSDADILKELVFRVLH